MSVINMLFFFFKGLKVPTMISTNAFTGVFQEIVNTYGVPR